MNLVLVAQIFNLLYRRFAIGSASANPNAPDHADAMQDGLRHGRLQICATINAYDVCHFRQLVGSPVKPKIHNSCFISAPTLITNLAVTIAPQFIIGLLASLLATQRVTGADAVAPPSAGTPVQANSGPKTTHRVSAEDGHIEPASNDVSRQAMLLLRKHCLVCHNDEKKKGGLILSSRDALLKGSENGPVVVPGNASESLLTRVLLPEADPHMPPKEQLSDNQIALLRAWIKEGLNWDGQALAEAPASIELTKLRPLPSTYHPALALAMSPDSTRLAAGRGSVVWIYALSETNHGVIARLEEHQDAVQSLAWSPNGKQLAAGGFRRIVLWDGVTLGKSTELTNVTGRVTALGFTADSAALIAADGIETQRGVVRIWKVPSGEPQAEWLAHADTILDLKVSPDGKSLATAGVDKLVKLWELPSGKEIAKFEGHTGHVLALGFKPDGSTLASGGADKEIKIWDIKTREQKVTIGRLPAGVTDLVWLPDGKRLVSVGEDGAASLCEESKDRPEKALASAGEMLHTVGVAADGKGIYAGGDDGSIHVWQSDGKSRPKMDLPETVAGSASTVVGAPVANINQAPPIAAPAQQSLNNPPLSFVNDILPILSKAGCNAGKCHAKAEGQNGFKLSVFAYDPKSDYKEIVKDARGRRIFPACPEESLLLRKPALALPHEGGERFERGSTPYQTLVRWIEQGMSYSPPNDPKLQSIRVSPSERRYRKGDQQPLRVEANYSDGSVREVTALADYDSNEKDIASVNETGLVTVGKLSGEAVIIVRFMGLVEVSRITVPADRALPDSLYTSLPVHNFIDEFACAQFKKLGLFPSDTCTDGEFLRRASLDAIGLLPAPAEARQFLDDTSPDKRRKLIGRLLSRPEYADHWANKWADLIRPNPDRVGVKSVYMLDQWLRESFRRNKPYDQFAREILTAQGSTHRYGPTVVFRDRREPQDLTTLASQIFLGVRLECARCHHHPNEKWSQDDFYQFAAYFGEIKRKGTGISPPISGDFEVFYHAPGGQVKHPVTQTVMQPKPPDGPRAEIEEGTDPRRTLANWISDPVNPFFARALVNRVWAAFMGRGFVDPVDDFRTSNPPNNEPLLDALAKDFIQHGYDLKHLMRTILQSHVYQLSSLPNEHNVGDTRNFSRAYRRRLPAEVLADAVADVTGVLASFQGLPAGSRANETWNYKISSEFMDAFGRPNSSSDCPCERDTKPSVVQALHLMNANDLQAKIAHSEGRAKRLASSDQPTKDIITELYLAALSRRPTLEELSVASRAFAAPDATRQTATEDILWALINSAEFVFNH